MFRAADENFILTFVNKKEPKTTIKVSKNIAKKAVDRNRIKRVIKEALKDIDLKNGETVIIVKRNTANLRTQEVNRILEKLINSKPYDRKIY